MVSGGRDVLVYTTISGAVGALIPFASMDDVEFMTTLEMVSAFRISIQDVDGSLDFSICALKIHH